MPIATINVDEVEKYPLTTLEGGFVSIRRMSYGAWLKRNELAMQMKIHGTSKRDTETELTSMQKAVTQYEFSMCIVDHNLTTADDKPLDFKLPHTLDLLHPKIGNEVAKYIAELHEFEDELPN